MICIDESDLQEYKITKEISLNCIQWFETVSVDG